MTITIKEKILEKVFQKNPDFHFWPLAGQLEKLIFEKFIFIVTTFLLRTART